MLSFVVFEGYHRGASLNTAREGEHPGPYMALVVVELSKPSGDHFPAGALFALFFGVSLRVRHILHPSAPCK